MDTRIGLRARFLRVKPLVSGLALALTLGSGSAFAIANKDLANRPIFAATLDRLEGRAARNAVQPRSVDLASLDVHWTPRPHEPTPVPAGAIAVTNCNDDGAGSLRDAIENIAVSGDTIDLTATGCSTITLTSGSIFMDQEDLTLLGPGSSGLIIDGSDLYSLRHAGTGTLTFSGLTVINGGKYLDASYNFDAKGGCLYSSGTLSVSDSLFKYCNAAVANTAYRAMGGALYGKVGVFMDNSAVFLGTAGTAGLAGSGGAIYTPGLAFITDSGIGFSSANGVGGGVRATDFVSKYSTITDNTADLGGGIYASGNVTIQNSTISSNTATTGGGAVLGASANSALTLTNSTISGNSAEAVSGLLLKYDAQIASSTIAFNTEQNTGNTKYGAVYLLANRNAELQSTIVATNTLLHSSSGPLEDDIFGDSGATLSGANNIIGLSILSTPPDTITDDPQLADLASNGGPTETHALLAGSPAIDAGNNAAGASNDQRGTGYPRVVGGTADIGAYEFNDVIFANGFD